MSRPFSAGPVRPTVRLRTRHAASAGFAVTRPAETVTDDTPDSADLGPCLVADLGVETGDGDRPGLATATAEATRERADTLGLDAVLLVPDPEAVVDGADTAEADAATAAVARALRENAGNLTVTRAPAGPYVAVSIETKAHPHADECRWIRPDERHRTVASRRVVAPDGTDGTPDGGHGTPVDAYLAAAERDDSPGPSLEPLQRAGLASFTRTDGIEQVHWTPSGTVVRDIVTTDLADRFAAAGASPVATVPPVHGPPGCGPAPSSLLATLETAEAATLPVRLSAAVTAGAGRDGRTRPAMVTVTDQGDAGVGAFESAVELAVDACADLGVGDVLVCDRAADAPVDDAWVAELVDTLEEPVVAERRGDESATHALGVTVYATEGLAGPVPLGRVRLDTSGEAVPDGLGDGRPWVVTVEPIGSVAGAVAALLARDDGQGLPVPLAPTQVRLVPIEPTHEAECVAVATRLREAGVRADVDDRERTVAARLERAAGVPYVAVVGDREASGASLTVRGPDGDETPLSVDDLEARVTAAGEGRPRSRTTLPVRVSVRPPRPGRDGDSER